MLTAFAWRSPANFKPGFYYHRPARWAPSNADNVRHIGSSSRRRSCRPSRPVFWRAPDNVRISFSRLHLFGDQAEALSGRIYSALYSWLSSAELLGDDSPDLFAAQAARLGFPVWAGFHWGNFLIVVARLDRPHMLLEFSFHVSFSRPARWAAFVAGRQRCNPASCHRQPVISDNVICRLDAPKTRRIPKVTTD